jgi:hypothetical protein
VAPPSAQSSSAFCMNIEVAIHHASVMVNAAEPITN